MSYPVQMRFLDRMALLSVLPSQGDIDTLVRVEAISKRVEITADEQKAASFRPNPGGGLQWNNAADDYKAFGFEGNEVALVKGLLDGLNAQKQLNREMIGLYLAFGKVTVKEEA